MAKKKSVLIIGAHPDDVELGCGGFIHSTQETHQCFALVLTQTNRAGVDLRANCLAALSVCGIPEQDAHIVDKPIAEFHDRETLWKLIHNYAAQVKPDLVFTHENDGHPHHELVNQETFNQSLPKVCDVATYSCKPYLTGESRNWYHYIGPEALEHKLDALECYDNYAEESYFNRDLIRSWATVCGFNHLGHGYAEAFRLERHYTGRIPFNASR